MNILLNLIKNILNKIKSLRLLKDTSWMMFANISRMVFQGLVFFLVAKHLGPEGFGAFSAVIAVASILAPFVHLGAYSLVIRDITNGIPTVKTIGDSLITSFLIFPIAMLIFIFINIAVIDNISFMVIIPIAISSFIGGLVMGIFRAVNMAHGSFKYIAYIEFSHGLLGALLVGILPIFEGDIALWASLYMLQYIITSLFCIFLISKRWGKITGTIKNAKDRIRLGLHFSVAGLASSAITDFDKTMLAKLSTLEATGVYSLAHRIINMLFFPLNAFIGILYPRFFKRGKSGYSESRKLAIKSLLIVLPFSMISIIFIWLANPLIIMFLGEEYVDAGDALIIMSLLLIVQGVQIPFADALTGAGFQKLRTLGQVGAVTINIILNLLLIPGYGWYGAVISSLITQILLLTYFVLIPIFYKNIHNNTSNCEGKL